MSNNLHTVRIIVSAFDQSNAPFDGYVTAKLGVPITSTDTLNEYITQLQVQRANFADGNCVLELIPSTLLSDDSYYVFQIVRNTPETVLLEAAAVVPDNDCAFSDLVDLSEYNLSLGNLSVDGLNLRASDKQKVNKLINEIRLAKVAFQETSDALITKTNEANSALAGLQNDLNTALAALPNLNQAIADLASTTAKADANTDRIISLESAINTINTNLSSNYSYITNVQISDLFTDTPQTSDYFSHYLFIVSGQSNASGSGNQGSTRGYMQSNYGLLYDWNPNSNTCNTFIPLEDPCYSGSGDSAWPAFCDKFYALTGKTPIIVNIASSSAAVTTFAGTTTKNSWANDGVGTLRTARGPIIVDAIKRLKIDSLQCKVAGILWCQGCAEGGRIATNYVTVNDYKQATKDVWAWTRNVIGKVYAVPVFVSQIGWSSGCFTGSNAANVYAGYQAVQNAQVELCNDASLNAFMGFDQAKNFYDPQNYRMDSGGIHYTQEGYREMGEALAVKAVQILNIELLPNVQENG